MRLILFGILLIMLSCGNKKVVELPKVNHSKITEVIDVSPAYLFYDETTTDSVYLNRKNLISTTNWLINVDKRLTLKQVIPHIKFLQNKKRNAKMHKNENAKNYFTCNNTSIKNLSFIEFTNVFYTTNNDSLNLDLQKNTYTIKVKNKTTIQINTPNKKTKTTNLLNLKSTLINTIETHKTPSVLLIQLNKNLNFQDYISIKSILSDLNLKNVTLSNNEFIF